MASGCGTRPDGAAPQARNGIAEYQEIAAESLVALDRALRELDSLGTQSQRCPPGVLAAFSDEVQRLQVGSLRVRAHAQAILARGDAYFENWHENLTQIRDPEVRALASRHRGELQASFDRIKQSSLQTREAFQPFLAGLRKLRVELEKDPGAIEATDTQALIRATREHGLHVTQCIEDIRTELQTMTSLLTHS